MRLFKDKYLYITFCLCALISGIIFGYYMIMSGGVFTLFSDYNLQQIPFATLVNKTIKAGSQWSWSTDLGTQLIAGYSFYNLGSPFYWITLAFPYDSYPYLMGWLFIFKYALAGAAAYAFMTYFLNDKKWGVFGGILYAFSGFQSLNIMFFHFHDVVALFPLLLIGLEEYIRKDKKSFFIFAVFINCITNYFFFVGEVVFVGMYYIARCIVPEKDELKRFVIKGLKCVGFAAIGVAMTAVIILPSVIFILGNYRTASGMSGLFYDRNQYLNIIRAFIWPIDVQNDHATVNSGEWNSISLYLPLWGISLYVSYVFGEIKKKNRLVILSLVLIAMSFIPLLNSIFYGLTEATYKRWWYMLILLMALCSARVMENRKDYKISAGVIVNLICFVLFLVVVYKTGLILKSDVVRLNIIVVAACVVIVLIIAFIANRDNKGRVLYVLTLSMTAVVACFTTFYTVSMYRTDADDRGYLQTYKAAAQLEDIDSQYRYNTNFNIFSLVGDVGNMGAFSSTVSNSVTEFHGNLGIYRENITPYAYDHEYNRILLGGKYNIVGGTEGYDVIENDDVCPIGYAVDSYVTEDEFREYVSANGYDAGVRLLIDSVAIKSDDVDHIDEYLTHNAKREVSDDIAKTVKKNQSNKVDEFARNNKGFACATNYDSDRVVYFTVPYDTGWTATVDGNKSCIINSNGMMCLVVPDGEHEVVFEYRTPGLIVGIVVSIISLLAFVFCYAYEVVKFKSDK